MTLHCALLLLILLSTRPSSAPNFPIGRQRRAPLPDYPIISCYSCASEEYEALFLRHNNVHLFGQPLLFDRVCDSRLELVSFGSTIPCDSNCVTVLEPQYFGGIQNERRPFTFVRGCATDIFALATTAKSAEGIPAEIEYLQRERICLELGIGQIWPELGGSREMVRVCSCGTDGCNTHDSAADTSNGATRQRRSRGGAILLALTALSIISHFLHILSRISHICR